MNANNQQLLPKLIYHCAVFNTDSRFGRRLRGHHIDQLNAIDKYHRTNSYTINGMLMFEIILPVTSNVIRTLLISYLISEIFCILKRLLSLLIDLAGHLAVIADTAAVAVIGTAAVVTARAAAAGTLLRLRHARAVELPLLATHV